MSKCIVGNDLSCQRQNILFWRDVCITGAVGLWWLSCASFWVALLDYRGPGTRSMPQSCLSTRREGRGWRGGGRCPLPVKRERERERQTDETHIYTHTSREIVQERERDRERERERASSSLTNCLWGLWAPLQRWSPASHHYCSIVLILPLLSDESPVNAVIRFLPLCSAGKYFVRLVSVSLWGFVITSDFIIASANCLPWGNLKGSILSGSWVFSCDIPSITPRVRLTKTAKNGERTSRFLFHHFCKMEVSYFSQLNWFLSSAMLFMNL